MRRIFFVDDEQRVVDGLRRMLRAMRDEWEMSFFGSGPAALDGMADLSPDIVVSDMRMPGMNGAEFLEEVRRRHPGTVRLILSGQCDRAAVLDAAGPAHQFLSKPCSAETLRNTIGHIFEVQDQLANAEIRTAVSRLQGLPIPENHLRKLADVFARPQASDAALIKIVHDDFALFSKCLQLVGCGFLGTQLDAIHPREIALAVGADTIRSIALEKSIFPTLPAGSILETAAGFFQRISRATAETARRIAAEENAEERIQHLAELGGYLARLGVAVLAAIDPAKYIQIWRLSIHQQIPKMDLEMRFYGVHRSDVGAYLLGLWGVPSQLVDIVRDGPWPRRTAECAFSPLTAVHAACHLVEESTSELLCPNYPLDLSYLEKVGVLSKLDRWRTIAHSVMEELEIAPDAFRITEDVLSPICAELPAGWSLHEELPS